MDDWEEFVGIIIIILAFWSVTWLQATEYEYNDGFDAGVEWSHLYGR